MTNMTKWTPFTRWDPFKEMEEIANRMGTVFGLAPTRVKGGTEEIMTVPGWSPLVDIVEDEKEYIVKTELPEVKKEDVKVNVDDGVLTISGERKFEKEEKDKKYHRIERSYGSFMRRFSLPDGADSTRINAEFKDGVLRVHLPKNEKAKTKSIEVKVQ